MIAKIMVCKIITPLFMSGADGQIPEIRPSEIKGMMRFWWRAINGHQSITSLKKSEEELFGSSDEAVGRSKFSLRINHTKLDTLEYQPVPTKSFKAPAFKPDQTFNLVLSANDGFNGFETIFNLLKISLILGGFGKRSRRGFGSLQIVKENGSDFVFNYSLESICNILNAIVSKGFKVSDNKIIRINAVSKDAHYPYIKEIEIGNKSYSSWEALIKKIGVAAHEHDCYYTGFTETVKVKEKNKERKESYRFASPVYVSIIKKDGNYYPIITTLNCALEDGIINKLHNKEKKTDKTNSFKEAVLS